MATLTRDQDGVCITGSNFFVLDQSFIRSIGCTPVVGKRFGMVSKNQVDMILTSTVTEIISESDSEVKFKTKSSSYILIK